MGCLEGMALCFGNRTATVARRRTLRKSNHGEHRVSARLAPLEPPFTEEVASALQRLMGGNDAVQPLALFRTLAHHDALLERFRQVGSALLSFGRIDPADRETVIHRTTARCGAAYEWGVHAALLRRSSGPARSGCARPGTAPRTIQRSRRSRPCW